ncbi:MAG: hypothetical protein EA377_13165 [Phycisphaerales bacterium]|nr:MAG: hypothetical protein EA377_13165 [Phycisphaerales bacterium]
MASVLPAAAESQVDVYREHSTRWREAKRSEREIADDSAVVADQGLYGPNRQHPEGGSVVLGRRGGVAGFGAAGEGTGRGGGGLIWGGGGR